MSGKMNNLAITTLVFATLFGLNSCASLDRGDGAVTPPSTVTTIKDPYYQGTQPKPTPAPVSPDYKQSMGEYPAGGVKPKHNATKDKETHKYEQEARKYEKEQRKKYEKDNEGHEKDRKEEYKHRETKTGKYPTPPNMPYQHPPAGCPPCPCAQPWPQMPHPNNDQSRTRRATYDDYWYGTGPANPVLSQVNMGYNAQMQIKDYFSKFGAPRHIGTINQNDFNYPNDFHAFEQPATAFVDVNDNIVYELRGPVEFAPFGILFGPATDLPDAFTTIVKTSGFFRLLGVQKDGLMKLMDEMNNVFIVDCRRQKVGNCQNLVQVRQHWNSDNFMPIALKTYFLNGLLDATLTQDAFQPTIELRTGTFVIQTVFSMDTFSMKETTTSKVYFVNCQKQRLPKSCGNLRPLS